MKKDINYITIDGRGEHESFRDCITQALNTLKSDEGIHIIKDFEPFPIYKMMEAKGFKKYVEKVSDTEYHAYFYKEEEPKEMQILEYIDVDEVKIKKILEIMLDFLNGKVSLEEAKNKINSSFDKIIAQEFAVCEQSLKNYDISDELLEEKLDDILEIFDDVLVSNKLDLPQGHPIKTYLDEVDAIKAVLSQMKNMTKNKFIKNQWVEVYEKLSQINIHFSRKQNQLFSALEKKGFDKPSKIMWTLDNDIKDIISKAQGLLKEDRDNEFMSLQNEVIEMVRDMMVKETEILFPTAMDLLSDEDFAVMSESDDEIGYCLIKPPVKYKADKLNPDKVDRSSDLIKDLTDVLSKHGILGGKTNSEVLDVSQGKLTLEQINLIFKHLQVDLSYVDENDIVKFYSDTKHRVFPRSAGVIGREVQNCHPRESVGTVERIIEAFRSGEQDEAEFWLEIGGKFIYIIYNAVRDEKGNFRGVLEMMQDVTHIRSLEGSQRLLTWDNQQHEGTTSKKQENAPYEANVDAKENPYGITKESVIGDIVKKYPYIKEFLIGLSPKFAKLKNPLLFKTMSSMATIEMISQRGGFDVNDFVDKIVNEIDRNG